MVCKYQMQDQITEIDTSLSICRSVPDLQYVDHRLEYILDSVVGKIKHGVIKENFMGDRGGHGSALRVTRPFWKQLVRGLPNVYRLGSLS